MVSLEANLKLNDDDLLLEIAENSTDISDSM